MKHNYRSRETHAEIAKLLRKMSEEWHTGVGPEDQLIMRPIDRILSQIEELKKLLDKE